MHVRNDKVPCEIIDVSMLGIGVLAPRTVLDGEFVRVVFRLGAANSMERLQQADGVVVRRQAGEIGFRLGIQFTVIEGQVASQIHRYVAEHTDDDPAARRRTGEYAPVAAYPPADSERITTQMRAVVDEQAATGTDGFDHDLPIDRELMKSYLESMRTVSRKRRD